MVLTNSIMNKENLPSTIPLKASDGTRISALNPNYLHSNSTSHTWPFSAIAELVDNAYDPDVQANHLKIDVVPFVKQDGGPIETLVFTDNGYGMTTEKIYKMLSFGFCEKVSIKGHIPVGHYGNGFKSGSMRLGKDALVFTKEKKTRSIGFLSQTFLKRINAETIIVPIVTWNNDTNEIVEGENTLSNILVHSIMTDMEMIEKEFDKITNTGTHIIISNLREISRNVKELDFRYDMHDIRTREATASEESQFKREERQYHIPSSDYSLRSYLAILYLKPKMKISLLGKKIKTLLISKSLAQTAVDFYKNLSVNRRYKITFGFSTNENHYGIMMYHRNRLIKPYVRVGCQLKADANGVGVIGVIECNELVPTHNKQDFDKTPLFNSAMISLGKKLDDYWNEKGSQNNNTETSYVERPDDLWAQCDKPDCMKWRKLPSNVNAKDLPDLWFCDMHPDPQWQSCSVPEEVNEDEEIIRPYDKKKKRQEKAEKQQIRVNNLIKEKSKVAEREKQLQNERKRREQAEKEKQLKDYEINRLRQELHRQKSREYQDFVSSTPLVGTSFGNLPSPSLSQVHASNVPPSFTQVSNTPSSSISQVSNVLITPRSQSNTLPNQPRTPMPMIQNVVSLSGLQNIKTEEVEVKQEPSSSSHSRENSKYGTKYAPIPLDDSDEDENQQEDDLRQCKRKANSVTEDINDNTEPMSKRKATPDLLSPTSTTSDGTAETDMFSGLVDNGAISSDSESSIGGNPVIASDIESDNLTIDTVEATVKTTVETIPLKVAKVAKHMATQTEAEDNIFDFNATFKQKFNAYLQTDNFEGIDKEILENLKDLDMQKMCLLLAQRSQHMKNLKKKIYSVLESLLDGSIQLPHYSENDIDNKDADNFLDAVVESFSRE